MDIRSAAPSSGRLEQPPVELPAAAQQQPTAVPEQPAASWRVNPASTLLKAGAAVAFMLVALLLSGDLPGLLVALLAAAVLGGYAVRDLFAPVRLTADAAGVTVVTGFAGRRRLAWETIDRVRVDQRRRLGLRSELLEIDADDRLYLLSSAELSASCADVADALAQIRRSVRPTN